jgi:hypothetical protein
MEMPGDGVKTTDHGTSAFVCAHTVFCQI